MASGILPFDIVIEPKGNNVTGRAGLPLALETMRALRLDKAIEQHVVLRERNGGFTETEKIESLVLLMAAGGDCLDDVRLLAADEALCRLLGHSLPSPDTLRRFLYEFHDDALLEQARAKLPPGAVAFVPEENAALEGLGRVNVALVRAVAAQGKCVRATLDHDATVIEAHKREAEPHYKGGTGYQPSVVFWAEQDLIVADEFRDGNVPAGMDNLRLIRRSFAALPSTIKERFFRADSACYESRVLKWLADEEREGGPKGKIGFTISADMTRELHAACVALPDEAWVECDDREGETVACAEVEFAPGDWPKDAEPLRYVALRIQKKQGRLFASGSDTKHLAIVSNRREPSAPELVRWHWQKAGTIELVHDVVKNELGGGVMPCGRFGANAAWFRLSLITYNVLSAMKSLALPPSLATARPKRLRFTVLNMAARVTTHAGKLLMHVGQVAEAAAQLVAARLRLVALLPATGE